MRLMLSAVVYSNDRQVAYVPGYYSEWAERPL